MKIGTAFYIILKVTLIMISLYYSFNSERYDIGHGSPVEFALCKILCLLCAIYIASTMLDNIHDGDDSKS